jgi:acetyl-CoA carboxylase beta subunit
MGKQLTLRELIRNREGVYAECTECNDQTYVDELEIENGVVVGICEHCLNSVIVTRHDLEHDGKSF